MMTTVQIDGLVGATFRIPYNGKFSRAEQSTRKLKLVKTPTHQYFTCKACGVCGFLGLNSEYYNCEHFF